MKRSDFRPSYSSNSISDKDRERIQQHSGNARINREYYDYATVHGEAKATAHVKAKYNADAYDITQAKEHYKYRKAIDKGTIIEHKEHPEFTQEQARQIATDHVNNNPGTYDDYYQQKFEKQKSEKSRLKDNYYIYDPKTGEKKGFYTRDDADDYATKSQVESGLPYKPEVHRNK